MKENHILNKLLVYGWGVLTLGAIIKAFVVFDHPHYWREIDTLGVTIRYYLRIFHESNTHLPFPAVLNSGHHLGIMPMEFTLLNFILSPMFVLGPYYGKVFASLALFLIHGGLVFWADRVWSQIDIYGKKPGNLFLWLPLVGLTNTFFLKFMPDVTACLLVLIAVGYCFKQTFVLRGIILLTLGILIKPTAIFVCGLLILHSPSKHFWKKNLLVLVPSLALAFFYYTYGLSYMDSLRDMTSLFATQMRNPLQAIVEGFSQPKEFFLLMLDKVVFLMGIPAAFFLSFLLFCYRMASLRLGLLWLVFVLQVLGVIFISGSHGFVHNYYFISLVPTFLLILQEIHDILPPQFYSKWLFYGTLTLGVLAFFDRLSFHTRSLVMVPPLNVAIPYQECVQLKNRNPQLPWNTGFAFQTVKSPFPRIGICFAEKVGAVQSKYGLYSVDQEIALNPPQGCNIIDQSKSLVIQECE